MAVVDPMERMISFRLSEQEYQQLRKMCVATRTRSISALVRGAMQHWLTEGNNGSGNDLDQKVLALEHQVAELTAEVEKLARLGSAA